MNEHKNIQECGVLETSAQLLPVATEPVWAVRPRSKAGVRVDAKFLSVNGTRFPVKGVTYGSFARNEAGEPFPSFVRLRDDFHRMRDAGINTVRLYAPPSDRIADAATDAGLFLIPDIGWGPRRCELDDPEHVRSIFQYAREHARRLADHPAMLLYSIGNEVPPLIARWYGRQRIEAYLRELASVIREQAPHALITYSNHPPTEYLELPFLDVISYNVYLHREKEFRAYLARLQTLSGGKPLFLSELGLNSSEHGDAEQAAFLSWQLRAVFEEGLCGAAVYSWTDEWTIFNSEIGGWAFGLTTAEREPKLALSAVRDVYGSTLYRMGGKRWPKVSVVVAVYNGGSTLDECLSALGRLQYPHYEVIVVNDGSTDDTGEIIARYNVHRIDVPNGGLSSARNLGIHAATGEIVAFIDSDAWPDENWLYYLVTAMDGQSAAAAGGPNLAPEGDGFVAECVDCAPGNPMHVLLDDQTAEHIPGCNMAFRKRALDDIGCFDATHRIAGDDVDVCWKLLVRGQTIAFSAAAVVHHHRRGTVRAYLRQQKNYGAAEAHLRRRYPGRYNFFGHQVWHGSVYDSVHVAMRRSGVPMLFASKVYQGRFGSAQFQSVYQPFLTWWFQIFTTVEWQGLSAATLLCAIPGFRLAPVGAVICLATGSLMFLAALTSAMLCSLSASRQKSWKGRQRGKGAGLVAFLHLAQPLVRAWGRAVAGRAAKSAAPVFRAVQRVYGNLAQRETFLEGLQHHLRACGWICRPASEWEPYDLEVSGPGPWRIFLTTVYEEDLDRPVPGHYVRYRLHAKIKPLTPLIVTGLGAAVMASAWSLWLLPLTLPLAFVLGKFLGARRTMTVAVSQIAEEFAAARSMAKVKDH